MEDGGQTEIRAFNCTHHTVHKQSLLTCLRQVPFSLKLKPQHPQLLDVFEDCEWSQFLGADIFFSDGKLTKSITRNLYV